MAVLFVSWEIVFLKNGSAAFISGKQEWCKAMSGVLNPGHQWNGVPGQHYVFSGLLHLSLFYLCCVKFLVCFLLLRCSCCGFCGSVTVMFSDLFGQRVLMWAVSLERACDDCLAWCVKVEVVLCANEVIQDRFVNRVIFAFRS